MAEKPILFSGEMVREILNGRKTQTRRVVVPQPQMHERGYEIWKHGVFIVEYAPQKCPYGRPGDLLWVRETWATAATFDQMKPSDIPPGQNIWYAVNNYSDFVVSAGHWKGKRRPSIFMPRWASRITLRVCDVRVEQLHDISEADAQREGWNFQNHDLSKRYDPVTMDTARQWFIELWNSINSKRGYGWAVNPWVWVVEFELVR